MGHSGLALEHSLSRVIKFILQDEELLHGLFRPDGISDAQQHVVTFIRYQSRTTEMTRLQMTRLQLLWTSDGLFQFKLKIA